MVLEATFSARVAPSLRVRRVFSGRGAAAAAGVRAQPPPDAARWTDLSPLHSGWRSAVGNAPLLWPSSLWSEAKTEKHMIVVSFRKQTRARYSVS